MNKFLLILLLTASSTLAIDEFKQDPLKGVGKQNRLKQIESYLTSFSKEYNTNSVRKLSDIEQRLVKIESKKTSSSNFDEAIKALREELQSTKKKLEEDHKKDIDKLTQDLQKAIKDQDQKREAFKKRLLQRLLVIEKIMSTFGKVKKI